MAKAMTPGPANDGGIVVALFLMAATIACTLFASVAFFQSATSTDPAGRGARASRLLRLLSGWANVGNSITHVLLVVYMVANSGNDSEYWVEERRIGGIGGPVFLVAMNLAAGTSSIWYDAAKFPLGWNSFVIAAGIFIPIVWLRFIEGGLASWPYTIILIWFLIFAFELTAFACSVANYALTSAMSKPKGQ